MAQGRIDFDEKQMGPYHNRDLSHSDYINGKIASFKKTASELEATMFGLTLAGTGLFFGVGSKIFSPLAKFASYFGEDDTIGIWSILVNLLFLFGAFKCYQAIKLHSAQHAQNLAELKKIYLWAIAKGVSTTEDASVIALTEALAPYVSNVTFFTPWNTANDIKKASFPFDEILERPPHGRIISYDTYQRSISSTIFGGVDDKKREAQQRLAATLEKRKKEYSEKYGHFTQFKASLRLQLCGDGEVPPAAVLGR